MFPLPKLTHIKPSDYLDVYEPSEDTFLLVDALEKDLSWLLTQNKPQVCMELGTGSGCVLTFLLALLKANGVHPYALGLDINPAAAATTALTLQENKIFTLADVINSDLFDSLHLQSIRGLVDVFIFNPPYVVTDKSELGRTDIYASWAGGHNGREVTDKILTLIPDLLSDNGVFYLVVIPQNQPQEIIDYFRSYYPLESPVYFQCDYLLSRRGGREALSIVKIYKQRLDHKVFGNHPAL